MNSLLKGHAPHPLPQSATRTLTLLTLLVGFLISFVSMAVAQSPLPVNWAKGARMYRGQFSRDGSTVLISSDFTVTGVRVSDGKVLGVAFLNGMATTSPVPLNDGSGFLYYANDQTIRRYSFSSRTTTVVRTETSPQVVYGPPLAISADGTAVAYQSFNSTTSRYFLSTFNLSTGALLGRVSMASSESISGITYGASDTRIVVWTNKGLRGFNASTMAAAGTRNSITIESMSASPDGTKVFIRDSAKMASVNVADMTQNWFVSTTLGTWYGVSSDNSKIVGRAINGATGYAILRAYAVSNGALSANTISSTAANSYEAGALSPTANRVLTSQSDTGARIEDWSFDASFVGSRQADFMAEVARYPYEGRLRSTTLGSPSESAVTYVDADLRLHGVSAATGASLYGNPLTSDLSVRMSPNGVYYARIGYNEDITWGMHVYRTSDNVRVASSLNDTATYCGWAGNGRLVLSLSTAAIRGFSFNGSSLAVTAAFTDVAQQEFFWASSDGTKLLSLKFSQPSICRVHDLTTGNLIGSIDMAGTYSGLRDAGFTPNGNLWLFDWIYDGGSGQYIRRVRFFDTAGPGLPVVKTISVPSASPYEYGVARVSSDGTMLALGMQLTPNTVSGVTESLLQVYRTYDSVLLSENRDVISGYQPGLEFAADGRSIVWSGIGSSALVGLELPVVLTGLTVNPTSVIGGNGGTGTVLLSRPAPAGGTVVSLTAGSSITVPATMTVPEGQSSGTFAFNTNGVDSSLTQAITATYDGLPISANVTINPVSALSISFSPPSVVGGNSSTGTVTLNGKAGPSGLVVALVSSSIYAVPPVSVNVSAQASSANFTTTTTDPPVTAIATITGSAGSVSGNGNLTVTATGGLSAVFDVATIRGGNALILTLTIGTPAPAGGAVYTMSSSDPAIAPPATITIPAGSNSVVYGIKTNPVLADTLATLTATKDGFSKGVSATIQPPIIKSVTGSHTSVVGDTTVMAVIILDGPAPSGMSVTATSTSGFVTVPASISIPAGQMYATVGLTCKKSTQPRTVTVTIAGKQVKLLLRTSAP